MSSHMSLELLIINKMSELEFLSVKSSVCCLLEFVGTDYADVKQAT
jgi:hypothetical protein